MEQICQIKQHIQANGSKVNTQIESKTCSLRKKEIKSRYVTHARAPASKKHAVPKETLYKKSLRERCANGSCPGARRGLWLEGLEAAEGYFRKRYRKEEEQRRCQTVSTETVGRLRLVRRS